MRDILTLAALLLILPAALRSTDPEVAATSVPCCTAERPAFPVRAQLDTFDQDRTDTASPLHP